MLAPGPAPPPVLTELIRATRQLTSRPFGVDFIVEDTAFGPLTVEQHLDVCIEEKVPVVVSFWHLPPKRWILRLKAAGIKVWLQTGSVDWRRRDCRAGQRGRRS